MISPMTFGVVAIVLLLLASPMLVGALFRRPLEGCLLSAFLSILLFFGGIVVAGLLAD